MKRRQTRPKKKICIFYRTNVKSGRKKLHLAGFREPLIEGYTTVKSTSSPHIANQIPEMKKKLRCKLIKSDSQ